MPTDPKYMLATSLQHYFVDKDSGLPLAGGLVEFFKDTNRTQHKPVFNKIGSPPYSFVQLPNPITLSAIGTIQDNDGNDILEYYYPYDQDGAVELYYIVVTDANNVPQFTREGFPSDVAATDVSVVPVNINYIINGQLDFNVGSTPSPITTQRTYLAAGPTAGLINPNISLVKNTIGATDRVTFTAFETSTGMVASPDPTPGWYMTYTSNIFGGEQQKYIEFPISNNAYMFIGYEATFSFQARSSENNSITVQYVQYYGDSTGGDVAVLVTPIDTYLLSPNVWSKYSTSFTIPGTTQSIGSCGNQYNSIRISLTPQAIVNVDLTCVQLTLGSSPIPFILQNSDVIAGQVFHPATGEVKLSIRPIEPGWVAMNDGTIGSATSGATNRANKDTFPLYYYLYTNVTNAYAPVVGGRGVNVYSDFSANKPITLTKALGRVLAGVNPTGASEVSLLFSPDDVNDLLGVSDASTFITGTPVQLVFDGVSPSGLLPSTTYYTIYVSSTTVRLASTPQNALDNVYVDFTTNGSGSMYITTVNAPTTLGQYLGNETHLQGVNEMPQHHHTITTYSQITTVSPGSGNFFPNTAASGNTGNAGGTTPFSILQPTTYMNIYIKL